MMTTTTPALSPSQLAGKLTADRQEQAEAIRLLEQERDGLLLAKHTGDAAATERSDAIRAELERRAAALREIGGLIARLSPRVELENRQAGLAAARARAGKLLEDANATLAAMHQVDLAIAALAQASAVAAPLVNAFATDSADGLARPGRTLEQRVVDTMIATTMGPLRSLPELIEDRLRSLLVLQVFPGERLRTSPLSQTTMQGCMTLLQRVQDRLRVEEGEVAQLAAEVEQRPDALQVAAVAA